MASLSLVALPPNVSKSDDVHALRVYVDEQRKHLQQLVGGMQNDFKRMTHIFEKSLIPNFPSHDIDTTQDSSAANQHPQSQPLFGMPMNFYTEQPQSPPPVCEKSTPLEMPMNSYTEQPQPPPPACEKSTPLRMAGLRPGLSPDSPAQRWLDSGLATDHRNSH
jgi:hypothetical protein